MEYSVKVDWPQRRLGSPPREEASTAAGSAPSTQIDEDEYALLGGRSLPGSPAHSRSPGRAATYAPVAGKTLPDHLVPAVLALMASTLEQAGALGGFDPKAHVVATEEAKIFVGGLPEAVSDAQVRTVFGQCGALKAVHVMRGGSDSGQACGFLAYWDRYSAELAIQALHKTSWPWAPDFPGIIVRMADAEKKRPLRPVRQDARTWKLFVGGLPVSITEQEVRMVFAQCGSVAEVHVMRGKSQSGQVCAFVLFRDELAALRAVDLLHQQPWPTAPQDARVSVRLERKDAQASQVLARDRAPEPTEPQPQEELGQDAVPSFDAEDFPALGAAPRRPRAGVWS